MQLHRFDNPLDFCDRAEPYLLQEEVMHNLLLRICKLFREPHPSLKPSYLAIVENGTYPVAVAIRTPPFPLVVSLVQDVGAIGLLAKDVWLAEPDLPAVNAPQIEADLFAEVWQQQTHRGYHLHMALRVHQLTRVQAIALSSGRQKLAQDSDLDWLSQWYIAFQQEAMGETPSETAAETWATRQITAQTLYVWQDGDRPVAVACGYGATNQTAVINFVYTPPQFRQQGYATACVATLSQHLLDQGYSTCALFTDLDNPTSNRIYQAIGYQPVCDWNHYQFHDEML